MALPRRLLLPSLLFFAALPGAPRADASDPPAAGDPRIGVWSTGGEDPTLFEFEPERLHVLEHNNHTFYFARLLEGGVVLWRFTERQRWKTRWEGDVLVVSNDERSWRLHRLEERPPELELPRVPLGEAKPLDEDRLEEIRSELRRRAIEDQAVRTDPRRAGDMRKVDADNTAWLLKTIADVGWIDAGRFGPEAANAAFLIVQHSGDVLLMNTVLPLIEEDVKAGAVDPQNFALLFDRLQLNLGRKQRFGTQIGADPDSGDPIVFPLEDPEHVEEIRREIGLFPLSLYLDFFEQQGGKRPVLFEWT